MRIRGIQLAGLAVALVGGVPAEDAFADITVSTATTAPLTTSGNGNVTIASGGSITVTVGQTAVTADGAALNVTNSGALSSNDANNTTGILLGNGASGTITSSGTMSLLESYAPTDTDSDGTIDGPFAIGTNRNGILLNAGAGFTGNVTSSGLINIEGNNSAGIRLNAPLTGDLTSTGGITIVGDNSYAVAVSAVSGNVTLNGTNTVHGANATGLLVNGAVGGNVSINGSLTVSGFRTTTRPADISHFDASDLLPTGSAVDVRFSIGQGLTIAGIGAQQDSAEPPATANITSFGAAPAIHIAADPSANLVLGASLASHGFGLDVRGSVSAFGIYDGVSATAIRIEGSGATTASITGGIALDHLVKAQAIAADAYGLYIGANATVPSILQRRTLQAISVSEGVQTAYGVYIASGAIAAPSFNNSGAITAQLFGEAGNATAIVDHSNTLGAIINTGTIAATIIPTVDIPANPITGLATAIDVSGSNINVTLTQDAPVTFLDDDTVDNDATSRPAASIVGDIRFGSGDDIFNLNSGTVTGDLFFGAGADIFNIASGASYTGKLNDSNSALNLNVSGAMTLTGGQSNITTATFATGSVLTLQLATVPANSATINASGAVNFNANSRLIVLAPAGLPAVALNQTILTAGSLNIDPGAHVTDNITTGTSYLYNFTIAQVLNTLTASYVLKTPAQLGLTTNQTIAFEPILAALRNDTAGFTDAVGAITDAATFNNVYAQMMPSYSSASAELATTAIAQQQSATTNRLANTRLNNLNEVSAWAQEIGYTVDRTPPDANGERFRGNGFGFAIGIDGPLNNGALFGLSASFVASEAEQPARPDGQVASSFGQLNAYLGTAMGPIDLDFVAGAGLGKMRERRFIEVGTLRDIAEANWWAYEGHGMVRASAPMTAGGWLTITPQAALTYVALSEQGYDEENAGALNISADSAITQRLWGDLGVEFSTRMHWGGQTVVSPRVSVGYRANLITDGGDRTFHFAGGNNFTLTDDSYGSGGTVVGVGLDATNGYTTVSLSYDGEFGDQIDRNSLNVALRFRF